MTQKSPPDAAKEGVPDNPNQPPREATPHEAEEAHLPEHHKHRRSAHPKTEISEEHFLRALTAFEAILVAGTEEKRELATRINWVIRGGIGILGLIAISLLILLLSLSAQVRKISTVVGNMNKEFTTVSLQMNEIRTYVGSMQTRVALLEQIQGQTDVMSREMAGITGEMGDMANSIDGVSGHVEEVRGNIDRISAAINQMNTSVQLMGHDMYRIGQPAQSMNKMFPFP